MIVDWDDAYANAPHIPAAQEFQPRWAASAQEMRNELLNAGRAELERVYGPKPRNRIDFFYPEVPAKGLLLFVHGGYWMAFDKSSWSHLAAGALARGWTVAMPSYTLAPEARISEITAEITRAIQFAAAHIDGAIHLAGHSAGGHLVTRQISAGITMDPGVRSRIGRVLSISGLHDLRPLLRTRMNSTLRLDQIEADSESPALTTPAGSVPVVTWVGADERPEFVRQTDLLANIWTGFGCDIRAFHVPARHHFNVIDDLSDPNSTLAQLCAP